MLLPLLALALAPNFVKDVYPVLKKADCMGCHQLNGVSSTTRLLFPEEGASAAELEAFGDSLRNLVDKNNPANSLLLSKPTNRAKHAGGVRIKPGSPEETVWRSWIEHLATSEPMARKASEPAGVKSGNKTALRRLTHSQYDNTVRDLLGDRTYPSKQFPPEDFIDGFKNQYPAQSVSPILAEAYGAAAEKLAANWQGKDPGPRFVKEFGRRAFRRPLTREEEARYGALYAKGGARLTIEAILQSPAFLYRVEVGDRYARASRLSYLLWNSMPTDELLAAAEKGDLDSSAGFEKWARKMLDDKKAREAVDEFVSQWFRFDSVVTMVKERRAYPLFTRELALAMTEETRRLAADLIWSDRNFMDLYTADYTFLNPDLASLYGMPPPPEEFAKVKYPDSFDRAGILGHATFLAFTSKPADTSITARGLFVREHLLCQQVPQPPPGVNANLPVSTAERPMTNREKLGVHLSNPSCASCHTLVDPIGYGLEKYDGIGARREKVKVEIPRYDRKSEAKMVDLPIDASGWVTGVQDSAFETPKQLGLILAKTPQCQECVVKQFFRYAMGRHESASDRPVIQQVTAEFRQSGFRFQDMMVSLVKWSEFPQGGR